LNCHCFFGHLQYDIITTILFLSYYGIKVGKSEFKNKMAYDWHIEAARDKDHAGRARRKSDALRR
jgi:hypothetical protein